MTRCPRNRSAYTLLEVLLATAIGVVLLGGLYVAVELHLRHAQIARDLVEESTLARAVLDRIAADVMQNLGPVLPEPVASSSPAPQAGSTTPSASGTAPAATPTPAVATAGESVLFNVGIQGDARHLVLSTSRYPRELNRFVDPTGMAGNVPVSDLRRISYWLAGNDDTPLGLARWEVAQATADDAVTGAQSLPDDLALVIAPEVVDLSFAYFDGSTWQESWDGTAVGPDGVTAVGPPIAVAIRLSISAPDNKSTTTYRRVVLIQTANGPVASGATTTP